MTEHPRAIDQVRRTLVAGLAATPVLPATVGVTAATAPSAQANSTSAVRIVVFDVNETLLDFGTLAPVFVRIFGDAGALRTWFNQVVLYSEALTLSGDYADAGTVGVTVLRMMAQASGRAVTDPDLDDLKHLLGTMPTYADTPKALGALRAAGYRLVTLSNTPTVAVDAQLAHAGIRSYFDAVHSIDDRVRRYKPARESYADLAVALGVAPSDLWLVSCHAFDTLGAAAAGYRTALVLRPGNAPVALGRAPDIVAEDLANLADHLVHADTRATGAK